MERFPSPEKKEAQENVILEALGDAGFYGVEAPRPGTKAYDAVMDLATKYIEMVRMIETLAEKRKGTIPGKQMNTLDTERQKLHDDLCVRITGKNKDALDLEDQHKVTNFAAYLVGAEEYVLQGNKFQSQTSYFRDLGDH